MKIIRRIQSFSISQTSRKIHIHSMFKIGRLVFSQVSNIIGYCQVLNVEKVVLFAFLEYKYSGSFSSLYKFDGMKK